MRKSKKESAGDELYTTYETVDKILRTHIADGKLRGKRILCPCDPILPIKQQPTKVYENGVHYAQGNKFIKEQQFVRWIDDHAVELGILSLTCSGLGDERFGTRFGEDLDVSMVSIGKKEDEVFDFQDGVNLKDKCDMFRTSANPDYDVIITNPPFSLGNKFVNHLLEHKKDFILILPWMFYGAEAFHRNMDKVKLGAIIDKPTPFQGKNIEVNDKNINIVLKGNITSITITIFTTFDVIENKSLHINQKKSYQGNEDDYPFALNTKEPVIVVDRTSNIPYDYDGLMCVPLTFMDKYNPEEFEVLDYSASFEKDEDKYKKNVHDVFLYAREMAEKKLLAEPNNESLKKTFRIAGAWEGHFNAKNTISWNGNRDLYYKNSFGDIKRKIGFIVKNKPNKIRYISPRTSPRLKNENPLLDNKIYFYSSLLVPDCICIGQTKGDVEKRIKQEFKNTPEKPYTILHSCLAQKSNGEWFRDKDFHKFLNTYGYVNEIGNHSRNNEWFKIDIKTVLKLFKEYIKK